MCPGLERLLKILLRIKVKISLGKMNSLIQLISVKYPLFFHIHKNYPYNGVTIEVEGIYLQKMNLVRAPGRRLPGVEK